MSANGEVTYDGGHYTSRQNLLLGVTGAGLVISTTAVALRLIARRYLHVNLWWDDYLAILAMIIQYAPLISTIISVEAGLGRHSTELSSDQIRLIGIMSFVHQLTYVTAFALVNITILILYVRIFPLEGLHKACWIAGAFTILWGLVNVIVLLTQCIPVSRFWAPETQGHCINQNNFYAAATVIATLNILVVFCIPIPIIWKLKISTPRKWSLAFAFTVGTLACIAAIIRLVLYFTLTHEDQSWTISRAIFWGCFEISAQVLAANVPSIMPLMVALLNIERRMSHKYHDKKDRDNEDQNYRHHGAEKVMGPKSRRSRKICGFLSLGAADALPESVKMDLGGPSMKDDQYDMRLIDIVKKSSERIVITDRIEQVSEPVTEVSRQPSAEGLPFGR